MCKSCGEVLTEVPQQPVPQPPATPVEQQGGGYSKELKEKLRSWLMGSKILDPSSANIIIDHFERYAHPSATAPSDAWISVEDMLPEPGIYLVYLVGYGSEPEIVKAKLHWAHGYWVHIGGYGTIDNNITHWQPLPPPPKK